jgi:hypothetical protein
MKYFIVYILQGYPSKWYAAPEDDTLCSVYTQHLKSWNNITEDYLWGEVSYCKPKALLNTLGKELSFVKEDIFYFESKEEAIKVAKFIKVYDYLENIEAGMTYDEEYNMKICVCSKAGKMEIV